MSHYATNWAIPQRGLKPATKIVLWHLCDRHNPDFGCFPTQARLAADCEMSVSSLNDHLRALEDARPIHRVRCHDRWDAETATVGVIIIPEAGAGSEHARMPRSDAGYGCRGAGLT